MMIERRESVDDMRYVQSSYYLSVKIEHPFRKTRFWIISEIYSQSARIIISRAFQAFYCALSVDHFEVVGLSGCMEPRRCYAIVLFTGIYHR